MYRWQWLMAWQNMTQVKIIEIFMYAFQCNSFSVLVTACKEKIKRAKKKKSTNKRVPRKRETRFFISINHFIVLYSFT